MKPVCIALNPRTGMWVYLFACYGKHYDALEGRRIVARTIVVTLESAREDYGVKVPT